MFKEKIILAIIPARSGSKGIKNKNIKKIKGYPLIYYSIKYAKKAKFIDKIVVSTDSKKYCKIVNKFGAETPFLRKKNLAGDGVQDYPVVLDALLKSENFYKKKFDIIVLLRPTSPFREKNLIEKSINILLKNKASTSVRSMKISNKHPYRHWIFKKGRKSVTGIIKKLYEPYNIPRQKQPEVFYQTGDIETIWRTTLINGSISGKNVYPLITKKKIIDIDTIKDLNNAKKIKLTS